MSKTYQTAQKAPPARLRLAAVFLALGLCLVLAFSGILYFTHSQPKRFNSSGYSAEIPENVQGELSPTIQNGRLTINGWALELHRYVERVEVWVVLYHPETDEYLRLPTTMLQDDTLNTQFEDGPKNYPYGGFTAGVNLSRLPQPVDEYEICLAFSHNQLALLIHTGQPAAGEGTA